MFERYEHKVERERDQFRKENQELRQLVKQMDNYPHMEGHDKMVNNELYKKYVSEVKE